MSVRHAYTGPFVLEDGTLLPGVRQAYVLHGRLNERRDNLVVLFHSLTGTPDPRDWWPEIVGPGRVIDTERYAVLGTNLLGSCYGTTRPPAGAAVTPRDMARLVRRLVQELGVRSVALAAGGSLGGMVALEWAATYPALTRAAVVFAAPAQHTAHAIGHNHVQRRALELGGAPGLELARMAAMLTYRTPLEFEHRFGRSAAEGGAFAMQSYLEHHGAKLRARFDAASYLTLLGAMDAHDVGRGRGGVARALRAFPGALTGVGIPGDGLYAPDDVRRWTDAAGARYRQIESVRGHDAFLLEAEQVAHILDAALRDAGPNDDAMHGRTQTSHADGRCTRLTPAAEVLP
jgi:homoserine O-acetyltransferase/O-succinyltransferase